MAAVCPRRSSAGGSEFDFERPPVLDGARLHREIPAERWCVRKADLAQLRRLAVRYVDEGRVVPTELDPFDASDGTVGPCIHTVNAQLIVPITRRAGGASWALMLHPEGLLCDVFVTHSWAEGIFEFLGKLLHSWPPSASHAYCCMLSNPQCLDIGGLLGSPRESPFAKALLTAPTMLVVPNHTSSIYSRVWCAYEAYLAYSASKEIITASARAPRLVGQVAGLSCAIAIAASLATFVFHQYAYDAGWMNSDLRELLLVAFSAVSLLVASLIRPSELTRAILYTGGVSSCLLLGWTAAACAHEWRGIECGGTSGYGDDCAGVPTYATLLYGCFTSLVFCVCILVAEADRLYLIQCRVESEELRNGYTGSLRGAESTVQEDKAKIMEELTSSGFADDVDQAIDVVLNAGALTQTLRTAILRVGMLEQAGCQTLSMAVLTWSSWVVIGVVSVSSHVQLREYWDRRKEYCLVYMRYEDGDCRHHLQDAYCHDGRQHCPLVARKTATPLAAEPDLYIAALSSLAAVVWLAMYCCLPWDKRIFAVRSLARVMGPALLALIVVPLMQVPQVYMLLWSVRILALVVAPAVLALTAAGPARTAAIPWLGPRLVRGLMVRVGLGSRRASVPPASGRDGGQRRPVERGGSSEEATAGASREASVENLGVP